MSKILLIEDNATLGKNVARYLELKGYQMTHFLSAEDGESIMKKERFSLILLDIHLPGMSGTEFLQKLRTSGEHIPIIFLTSKDTDDDIVRGLQLGADDYVSKPFDYEVLIARIESVMRRGSPIKVMNFKIGNYIVDMDKEQVYDSQSETYIYLSQLEFKLLQHLIENKEKICDRKSLYESVWGEFEDYYFSRTVDVYISYLRKKLGTSLILTRKGSGYILNSEYEYSGK